MTHTVIFDDDTPLAPLTDLRPVYRVRTGVATTLERWERHLGARISAAWIPERLRDAESEHAPPLSVNASVAGHDEVLLINGACVLPMNADDLKTGHWICDERGNLLAARLTGEQAQRFLEEHELPSADAATTAGNDPLLHAVSDVIRLRDLAIAHDLEHLAHTSHGTAPASVHIVGEHPVVFAEGCDVWPGVVIDATGGPVLIELGATIRPGVSLIGPCAVLGGATVADHAVIRANTVIGPVCKVGGEVGGTIFQGHANKGHDGYLGDAYVGEWVNLGAGTNNSNLLNTYGSVKAPAHIGADRASTGLTFYGGVIGDHAKTMIGTRLPTGCPIGTGAMCASSTPPMQTTERFLWLTDEGAQRYRWVKFEEVARAVMARRNVTPGKAYIALLRSVWEGSA